MSVEAETMVLNKKAVLIRVQTQRAGYLRRLETQEKDATHQLENTVAFLVSKRSLTLSKAARLLGVSRDKVRGMVKRANERNREMLRSGHGD